MVKRGGLSRGNPGDLLRGFVESDSVRFSFAFAIMAENHRLGIGGLRESSSKR